MATPKLPHRAVREGRSSNSINSCFAEVLAVSPAGETKGTTLRNQHWETFALFVFI